jgi:hypothetical protein
VNQHHLIIGPDESSCTEEIPAVYVQKLMDIGILELCETVNHVRSDVPACQTLIYRMKGKVKPANPAPVVHGGRAIPIPNPPRV